ncbi:unnamed protein product [Adineta ricciae]|uniref:Uncharacterized protein n=1 Tax=Adineta ricciae TaxID=249248 RepID=A0A813PJ50_ADIRI|nr:unnamed protein product [Adineta ricciae]CAF1191451.1 unnamed protein product [Adineta ricciae]
MCTIIKDPSIIIKCSNPMNQNAVESITCMAVESNAKAWPIRMIWFYPNKLKQTRDEFMPSKQLQLTLSNTLNYFTILAGRGTEDENGNVTVHLNNEGVLYTDAHCPDQSLDYFIQRTDDEEFDYEHINSSDLDVLIPNDFTGPLTSIQVTRLQCDSVVISIVVCHCLMDAQSSAHFITSWAAGGTPKNLPMMDKSFILFSTEEQQQHAPLTRPANCVFTRDLIPSPETVLVRAGFSERVISRVYHFSADELKNIKAAAMKDLPSAVDYISTYDALYAHMVLVIAQATQKSFVDNDKIKILQSLNGRTRFAASYSPETLYYFGSFAFWLFDTWTADEPPTLPSLAKWIHEMHAKQTIQSLKYYNAYLTSGDGKIGKNQVDADIINHDFHCASWRKVNMLGGNFGGGDNYPIYSGPTKQVFPQYFAMMDSHKRDESVNILLALRESDYTRLLEQKMIHKYR